MSDIAEAFHAAQEAALRSSTELAELMGGRVKVYSSPPTNTVARYILIGDDLIVDDGDECQDGSEIFANTKIYWNPDPPEATTARRVASIVRRVLNTDLNIEGHETILHAFDDMQAATSPEGVTVLVVTHRYLTTPSAA